MSEENKNLVRFYFDEILNKKNLDGIEPVITGDSFFRAPNMPEARGCEETRQAVLAVHTAFPDICYAIEDMIAEGDRVVARWSVTGTQKGEWMGIKPTGKALSISGVSIFRILEGKIAEQLVQFDSLGAIKQLSPPPSPHRSEQKPKPKPKPKKKVQVRKKAAPKAKKRTRR